MASLEGFPLTPCRPRHRRPLCGSSLSNRALSLLPLASSERGRGLLRLSSLHPPPPKEVGRYDGASDRYGRDLAVSPPRIRGSRERRGRSSRPGESLGLTRLCLRSPPVWTLADPVEWPPPEASPPRWTVSAKSTRVDSGGSGRVAAAGGPPCVGPAHPSPPRWTGPPRGMGGCGVAEPAGRAGGSPQVRGWCVRVRGGGLGLREARVGAGVQGAACARLAECGGQPVPRVVREAPAAPLNVGRAFWFKRGSAPSRGVHKHRNAPHLEL